MEDKEILLSNYNLVEVYLSTYQVHLYIIHHEDVVTIISGRLAGLVIVHAAMSVGQTGQLRCVFELYFAIGSLHLRLCLRVRFDAQSWYLWQAERDSCLHTHFFCIGALGRYQVNGLTFCSPAFSTPYSGLHVLCCSVCKAETIVQARVTGSSRQTVFPGDPR